MRDPAVWSHRVARFCILTSETRREKVWFSVDPRTVPFPQEQHNAQLCTLSSVAEMVSY